MPESGERRMLFDMRGRRKRVIQVVYAILALLMAASLFLVTGGLSIGDLFGGGVSTNASESLDKQAERIEKRLQANPNDPQLLQSLVRVRVSAGNTLVSVDPATQQQTVPAEAQEEYRKAAAAWNRYMKNTKDEPSAGVAQLAANAFFTLAQNGTTAPEVNSALRNAAEAQKIVAEARPTLGSLSTLAIYQYFTLDFATGDKTAKKAEGKTTSKSQAKAVRKQLASLRKRAKKYQKQQKLYAKFQKSQGKQELKNPLGSLSGGGGGFGTTPTAP